MCTFPLFHFRSFHRGNMSTFRHLRRYNQNASFSAVVAVQGNQRSGGRVSTLGAIRIGLLVSVVQPFTAEACRLWAIGQKVRGRISWWCDWKSFEEPAYQFILVAELPVSDIDKLGASGDICRSAFAIYRSVPAVLTSRFRVWTALMQ